VRARHSNDLLDERRRRLVMHHVRVTPRAIRPHRRRDLVAGCIPTNLMTF